MPAAMPLPDAAPLPADRPVHAMPAAAVLAALDVAPAGLAPEEVTRRRAVHGLNGLPEAAPPSALLRFARQFNNLLILILIGAAGLMAAIGHATDAAVILAVVLINAVIGHLQEGRAARALAAIRDLAAPTAIVRREGAERLVPAQEIVPGDLVRLSAGARVPADLRLVEATQLRIDEAALTGESVPVTKDPAPAAAAAALAERTSMAYSGTLVVAGQGLGVAVATGPASELGRISTLVGTVEALATPLVRRMNAFARVLTFVILGLALAAFIFAVFVRGFAPVVAFLVVVSLAVSAIPEGLPAVMTIALAIAVERMAGRRAIVRRLPAVETLGSVSVICTDKTGTLTRNEMAVGAVRPAPGAAAALARAALLCNDAGLSRAGATWRATGDPVDAALALFAAGQIADPLALAAAFPRADTLPFSAELRLMATRHTDGGGGPLVLIKGAPETILNACSGLDPEPWLAEVERLASEGMRVLALAERRERDLAPKWPSPGLLSQGFHLLGLVGLIDPPRPEAAAAIAECRRAGVKVKMITGDHAVTAAAIGRAVGLGPKPVVATGSELAAQAEADLPAFVAHTDIFARAAPEHKLRIVRALQGQGLVVAMTGDGVNDAPALKRADVGVAMGRKGTEAAKEAAEIVLADDNFATIVAAIREGRTVYDNLRRMIAFTLPTNGGEAACILAALLLGFALPMTALQILWINLVTEVALGLVFAFEPTGRHVMQRRPRPLSEPMLPPALVWQTGLVSLLFAAGVIGLVESMIADGRTLAEARTAAVNLIVLMEIAYIFNLRPLSLRSFRLNGSEAAPVLWAGILGTLGLQLLFTYAPPLQALFETAPLGAGDWLIMIAMAGGVFLLVELDKAGRRRLAAPRA